MISTLFALLARSYVVQRVARMVSGGFLGLAVLAWVISEAMPPGEVVVHVAESEVELTVGLEEFRIDRAPLEPILVELPRGHHELIVRRDGRELYRESFSVRSGKTCVLTAYDPARLGDRPAERW